MKDLLLVGVGVMGRPYLDAAARLGLRVRAVDVSDPERDGVEHHPVDNSVEESWVGGVTRALAAGPPGGIVAFAEPHVVAAALAQERLELPGPSLHAATISRNKAMQRSQFGACGVAQPEYLVTEELEQARPWLLERLPVVVKPLDGSGSHGVELIADKDAVDEVVARRGGEGKLLVETAVQGPEYSWEALVGDGEVLFENITAKETTPPPYFVELCHRTGHAFESPLAEQVNHLTRSVLRAIGMRTGLMHLEFRVGPQGPVLMEVAVRTPGDYLVDAVNLAYGTDLYEAVVRLALGMPVPEMAHRPRSYAATVFLTCDPGRVTQISGEEEVAAHPDVARIRLRYGPGHVAGALTSSDERLGHVLVNAASAEEREEAVAFVRQRLRVTVEQL
ncbi:ATP-grasp domain-containing protein [Salinactinospora qingdaonensis]|uniref:ATP-grasp domain-containing protein n=1 Tax=Salinactinospora qingdaonensis TaxID=702744 RepID=A0ABP7ERJ5_9ACTN